MKEEKFYKWRFVIGTCLITIGTNTSDGHQCTMFVVFELLLLLLKIGYFYLEALVRVFIPPRRKDITGQNVLITGGAGGIGRELAIKFSQCGAKIALWDLDKQALENTAEELKIRGAVVYTYQCDITDKAAVKRCAAELRRDMGELDILVNNAGVLIGKPFLELDEKDIRKTFEVNVIAHFWTIKEFLPSMMERNHGHLVTVASMAAKMGSPLLVDYCASKYAAYGLLEALMIELHALYRHCQVHTSIVCPVFVNTNLIHGQEITKRITRRDRFGLMLLQPEDVAEAAVDGVLRNKLEICIPMSAGFADISRATLPVKASLALADFIDCQFVPVDKRD